MRYTMKAHPTTYAGVRFRSRLEARWAAFFDLAGWSWEYEPADLAGWSPDFLVHVRAYDVRQDAAMVVERLYAEVKPYTDLEQFHDHPAWSMMDGGYTIRPAVLGVSPVVSQWITRVDDIHTLESHVHWLVVGWSDSWKEAGNLVQWRPRR